MRILRIVDHVGPTSAPYDLFTLPLLDEHRITLCSLHPATTPVDCRVDYCHGGGRTVGFVRLLAALLRSGSFDVVHVHSPYVAVLWILVALAVRPDLLRRSMLHVHGSFRALRFPERWMLLPAFLLLGRVICGSHAARYSFPLVYRWLARRRLVTIRDGVDVDRADRQWLICKAGIVDRTEDLQLISVGSLQRWTNHATLLRALASTLAKDIQLTIIGDGPARKSLSRLARDLKIADRVHFAGALPGDRTLQALWAADGYISMSRDEAMPVAVLEAMCCHCPVLLSDTPAHREIRGRRWDLIPLLNAGDVQALADAIDDWAGMPMDVMRAWGADCRQHVEYNFALETTLEQFQVLLQDFDPVMTPEWQAYCRSLHAAKGRRVA